MAVTSGTRTLTRGSPGYPLALERIPDPPARLHITGELSDRDILSVAIVGSRHPTPYGLHMARSLAGNLARSGVTIVSGLARGIDTEAHKGALFAGGRTLAVLGCGLDADYPRNTRELKKRIIQNGAILSEFEPGSPPLPHHFPSRNRIISGLSLGVVVVEAGIKSGSLITARWALDQGREVMAVPGRADSSLSEGPIGLIREGAPPVCGARDVIRILDLDLPMGEKPAKTPSAPVLAQLSRGPCLPEDISRLTGLPVCKVLAELSRHMIEGKVGMDQAGTYFLK